MINVEINGNLVGQCESAGKASSPLFKDVIDPWIEIRGFIASSPSLTDDQQVVLNYLKSRYHDRAFPFDLVGGLNSRFFSGPDWETDEVLKAYGGLNSQGQLQVLAAFASYGLEDNQ